MIGAFGSILFRHDLNEHGPFGKITFLNAVIQIPLITFPAFAHNSLSFRISEIFDSLLGMQVKLDPVSFVFGIDKTEGMAAKTVHMPIGRGNAPVAHDNGNLMQSFGQRSPEIPVVFCTAQVGAGIAFDRMIEIRKFQRITQEKYRCIVAHKIPVAFLCIKFHGKTANIPFRICRAAFSGHSGKTNKEICLFSHLGENFCFGVFADVMRNRECAIGSGTFGVHPAFGNHFPVKMCKFFQKPDILQKHWPPRPGSHYILVVRHRRARVIGQFPLFRHVKNLLSFFCVNGKG